MLKCIFNGEVLAGGESLPHHAVIIEGDRIRAVLPTVALEELDSEGGEMEYYDAHGGYILPGFIDVHADYLEGVIQPRPTSIMDFSLGLREAEKNLCGQGVTIMYHSLSLMQPKTDFENVSIRAPQYVEKLVRLIASFHDGRHLIRHRFHARYEIDNLAGYDQLEKLIEENLVHELSFMDHTPGQGQYRDVEKYAVMFKNWKQLRTDEDLAEYLKFCETKPKASHEMLLRLAALARERDIPIAAHDVDSEDKVTLLQDAFGIDICEFPITLEVAAAARARGMLVVVGAPNILLGKSHSGNLSAMDAIRNGCADILCSDYYPAALLHSVFRLADEGILPLPRAIEMVTLNPARAMRIDQDYGSVAPGKKADLLVVRKLSDQPTVEKVFINGSLAMSLGYRVG